MYYVAEVPANVSVLTSTPWPVLSRITGLYHAVI